MGMKGDPYGYATGLTFFEEQISDCGAGTAGRFSPRSIDPSYRVAAQRTSIPRADPGRFVDSLKVVDAFLGLLRS